MSTFTCQPHLSELDETEFSDFHRAFLKQQAQQETGDHEDYQYAMEDRIDQLLSLKMENEKLMQSMLRSSSTASTSAIIAILASIMAIAAAVLVLFSY